MSILSDKSIAARCIFPDKILDMPHFLKLQETTPMPDVYYPDPMQRIRARKAHDEHLAKLAMRSPSQEERESFVPMIEPFLSELIRKVEDRNMYGGKLQVSERKVISYGSSSYGYDARLAREVKIFSNTNATIIDPKRLSQHADQCLVNAVILKDEEGAEYFILPPNSYALGYTVEYFRMPRDITSIVLGKSTYARAGLQVNATPIEAGFEGTVVLELANSTSLPMRVYIDEGIAQFLFFEGDGPCNVSYSDRGGKYQGQTGLELSKV